MALTSADLFLIAVISLSTNAASSLLQAYFKRKGENLAAKEDGPHITRGIEGVKHEFAVQHALRFAAIDRRLQAHQEAFCLWRRLLEAISDDAGRGKLVLECQDWYRKNCLYLEKDAREAFSIAYSSAGILSQFQDTRSNDSVVSLRKDILNAGKVIAETVSLPGLTVVEEKAAEKELKKIM